MSEADEKTIARQQQTIKDMYAEIVDLRVDLGELKEAMGGWGPVVAAAIEMGKDK